MTRGLSWSFLFLLVTCAHVLAQGTSTGNTAPATTGDTATSGITTTAPATSEASTASTQAPTSITAPTITSATTTGTAPPLPTLSGVLPPPLIVPDTSGAPFMRKSNLPEGTVFIAVGAALGFLGLCVLAWRTIIAWSLRRSVKRAAYAPDAKSMFGLGPNAGYKSMYTESNMSLEQLGSTTTAYTGAGAGATKHHTAPQDKRTSKHPRATRPPTDGNLFFSPTAGPGIGKSGTAQGSARSSAFLPSGYYTSNATGSNNYGRSRDGISPPDSPSLRPQSSHLRPNSGSGLRPSTGASRVPGMGGSSHGQRRSRIPSSQNLNVASPTQGRTPSAHFETLLDIHGHGPSERF